MRKQDRSEKAKAAVRKHQRLSGTDIKNCRSIMQENTGNKYIHPTYKCSFCGKNNHESGVMIAAVGVAICQDCILSCVEIVFKEAKKRHGGAE